MYEKVLLESKQCNIEMPFVTLDHKTSLKYNFFEIEIYT